MSFYDSYSFFICLFLALLPAVFLGVREKRIAPYGFFISLLFIFALFLKTPQGLFYFLLFLFIELVAIFFFLKKKQDGKGTKLIFWSVLGVSLLPLVCCKLSEAFSGSLFAFIGISYITFKTIQMVLEIHDGLIKEMSLFDCLYFLIFFAPFTSGPIDRSRRFIEDANKHVSRSDYLEMLGKGLSFIIIGLAYSVVMATLCYRYYTPVAFPGFSSADLISALITSGKSALAYAFYLFFNFAGYSLMAVGVSYCFGIATPKNFKAPFKSVDIKDFWNRWHMTLSFWLRDFIFMRFARLAAKKRLFSSRLTTACCGYLIDMTLMGFWHGITLDYIFYGIYHGTLLSLTDIYQKKSKFYAKHKNKLFYKAVSWAFTFCLVVFGFAIFSGQLRAFI